MANVNASTKTKQGRALTKTKSKGEGKNSNTFNSYMYEAFTIDLMIDGPEYFKTATTLNITIQTIMPPWYCHLWLSYTIFRPDTILNNKLDCPQ